MTDIAHDVAFKTVLHFAPEEGAAFEDLWRSRTSLSDTSEGSIIAGTPGYFGDDLGSTPLLSALIISAVLGFVRQIGSEGAKKALEWVEGHLRRSKRTDSGELTDERIREIAYFVEREYRGKLPK